MKKIQKMVKRIFDIIFSLIFLIILSPIMLIIALIIKTTSQGPVLFKQKRIGKNGHIFEIFKFRTMVLNAENIGDGLSLKSEKDKRITSVGSLLRKTSLDEIPQLFNVLFGQMSIVGPRPPVTYHPYKGIEGYPEWAKKRFTIRPGITGLAQVKVRNSVSWDERIKYDIMYIKNFNIILDLKIIFKTFLRVISTEDIYN
ncbi:sugar transferase [Aerococcus urinaeequi]|uniref:sugar transferase n=1 Tax=Aerococcus urinaeequi TaxID=51665 RepID=UPI003D6ADB47